VHAADGVGRRFRGAKNIAAGRMLTVTLINDLDGTVHL
jgi:hypothetical protein